MNNDDPILTELRKISSWSEIQRKTTKWSLVFIAAVIPVLLISGALVEWSLSAKLEGVRSEEKPDWYDVDQNIRRGDFDKAIQIGERLILKTPLYPEAHRRLAGAYLAAGSIEKARKHFAEAFRLFPSEENEKLLASIDRRMKTDNLQLDGAVNAASPHR